MYNVQDCTVQCHADVLIKSYFPHACFPGKTMFCFFKSATLNNIDQPEHSSVHKRLYDMGNGPHTMYTCTYMYICHL